MVRLLEGARVATPPCGAGARLLSCGEEARNDAPRCEAPCAMHLPATGAMHHVAAMSSPAQAPRAHSPARIVGHGAVVLPRTGYQLERVAGASESTLRVTYGEDAQLLDVSAPEAAASALAEVAPGPLMRAWRIETDTFTCAWPRGLTLADDPDALSAFVLAGPNGALIWASGPMPRERATPIESLADEGQNIRAVADEGDNVRIDLDYVFEGEPWWQRRYVLAWSDDTVLVVSAQAKALDEEVVAAAIDELAQSIAPSHLN